ncbi:S-Ena type endospore appendage [Paenibacillus sp. GCM10012307]|uniref:DUF3992 domain-containing protein n=1 Tax=Paenibacillus roseus TaxID=2798579 RepID=A0A934IVB7_9BACL|nr:S-Ena type endospore appendage [Paenibacillus roseus]MBJ6359987.1 DUF3992 domain-containing protein [Paenibacillus roseus]
MSSEGCLGIDLSQDPAVPVHCLQCPWYVYDLETAVLYTTNEIIRATGTISSSPGSIKPVQLQFTYRNIVLESITLPAGHTTAFTIAGFDQIRVLGVQGGNAMGDLMLNTIEVNA